jgi:hypothetical protein
MKRAEFELNVVMGTVRANMGDLLRRAIVSSLLVVLSASPTWAGPVVLDQEFDPTVSSPIGFAVGPMDVAQTFTVGRAGRLASVEMNVRRGSETTAGDLIVELRHLESGAPTQPSAPALASVAVPRSLVPADFGFVSVDFSAANVHVGVGDVLSLVLRDPVADVVTPPVGSSYEWKNGNGYAGGVMFLRNRRLLGNSAPWAPNQNIINDVLFRTFVEVPEPAGGLLWLTIAAMTPWRRFASRRLI